MKSIRITGTGSYLPKAVLTNFDLEGMVETSDEWIRKRTGIKERRVASTEQSSSDLAREAALQALSQAGRRAADLDLIVMATITPDTCCPSGANWLESKIKAAKAVSFDVTAACCGFIFALSVAEQYLKNGTYHTALVVAAEVMSRTVNWQDRSSCILWGDGAGAAVLESEVNNGAEIISTILHTDGSGGANLLMPGGGSKTTPISHESVDQGLHYLRLLDAPSTFKVAVAHFTQACEEAVERNGLSLEEISLIIPHQANLRIMQAMAKKLKIPMEKIFVNIDRYGNMSSASMAVALDEAVRQGQISKGDYVLLCGFGGGLTWGSCLLRW
ncbi:MAG: ketoacyl-ACP synthase III [Deltaproteobacteria bacterium]|nr:ketoacyl-ACP synthase III [Deltaproteobacteria bacterium]MBW2070262.1 ketoacyl-ACP synthase III [Deltaproteobacteria bacterium]